MVEREFITDCKLLGRALPELIGIDAETNQQAELIVRRFIGMQDAILKRVEEVTEAGHVPSPKLVRSAEIGMKRLLEMAALNQRSAVEYVKASQREAALQQTAQMGFIADADLRSVIEAGPFDQAIFEAVDPRDRDQAGIDAFGRPCDAKDEEEASPCDVRPIEKSNAEVRSDREVAKSKGS